MSAIDVTDTSFQAEVVEASFERPVVIAFHAKGCDSCRELAPLLEQAVGDRDLAYKLVAIDVDANPEAITLFGIQNVPAVKGVRDGILRAEFHGVVPLQQIDAFLDQLPATASELALKSNDQDALRAALNADPLDLPVTIALGRIVLDNGDPKGAFALLLTVAHHPIGAGLFERARLLANPTDDPAVAACLTNFNDDLEGSLDALIDLIASADIERLDVLRRIIIGVFAERSEDDPIVVEYRRRLASSPL